MGTNCTARRIQFVLGPHDVPTPGSARFLSRIPHRGARAPAGMAGADGVVGMKQTTRMTLKIIDATDGPSLQRLLERSRRSDRAFDRSVRHIVDSVRHGGDSVLLRFARKFDQVQGSLEISDAEMRRTARTVDRNVQRAIAQAAKHITRVARRQLPKSVRTRIAPGVS